MTGHLQYKSFPKSDARRYFVALLAVERLQERATLHYVSLDIGCARSEVQRALEFTAEQFGVVFERDGSVYKITSWGILKKNELENFLRNH